MANTSPESSNLPEGGDESNDNDNHGSPAGRRGLPEAVREPPRVHDAVHAAAPENGAALLLSAKQERDRHPPDAGRRNQPPAPGRQDYRRSLCHQPLDAAL